MRDRPRRHGIRLPDVGVGKRPCGMPHGEAKQRQSRSSRSCGAAATATESHITRRAGGSLRCCNRTDTDLMRSHARTGSTSAAVRINSASGSRGSGISQTRVNAASSTVNARSASSAFWYPGEYSRGVSPAKISTATGAGAFGDWSGLPRIDTRTPGEREQGNSKARPDDVTHGTHHFWAVRK